MARSEVAVGRFQVLEGQLTERTDLPRPQPPHDFRHDIQVDAGTLQGVVLILVHPPHKIIQERTEDGHGAPPGEASGT
jgi:hypothetical protein